MLTGTSERPKSQATEAGSPGQSDFRGESKKAELA